MHKQLYIPATMLAAFVGDSPYMTQEEAINEVLLRYYYKAEVVEEPVVIEDPVLLEKATEIINSETISKEQHKLMDSIDPEIKSAIYKARGTVREVTTFDKLTSHFSKSKKYKDVIVTPNSDKNYYYVADDCIIGGVVDGVCYKSNGEYKGIVEIKNRVRCSFNRQKIYQKRTDLYQLLTYYKAFTPYFDHILPEGEEPLIGLVQVYNGKLSLMEFKRTDLDELWIEVETKLKRAMKIAANMILDRTILEATFS